VAGPDDEIMVGVVGKAFGLRGEVYVQRDPDVAADFAAGRRYRGGDREFVVAGSRDHSGRCLVRFEGVEDRGAAEALRGCVLTAPRAEVAVPEDAYWTADLIGLPVLDGEGTEVGRVRGAVDGAAHDFLVIAGPAGEVLVPAHADLIEVTTERVVLLGPPDLLDPSAQAVDDPTGFDHSAAEREG
jgi:16S rRNA processing protein RimM